MLSISLSSDFEVTTLTARLVAGSTGRFVSSDAAKSSPRVLLVGEDITVVWKHVSENVEIGRCPDERGAS